jgi:hypothetical protein
MPRKKGGQKVRKNKEKVTAEFLGFHYKNISQYNMRSKEYISEISK